MTREEILDKIAEANGYGDGIDMVCISPNGDASHVYTAMSEFAQQEAIAFAEWKDKGCRIEENNKYYYLGQLMTYEQLYSLFKKQDNG